MPSKDKTKAASAADTGAKLDRVRGELDALTQEAEDLASGVSKPGTDLVPTRSKDPAVVKQQMAAVRAQAQKTSVAIKEKQKELTNLLKKEMERAERALGPMQELMKQLEENIFTVNLYLGRDEEILLLRDGASAPAEQPITMRQLLLYMDEECAVAAEEGGIDPTNTEEFDKWLMADPAHLDQVLPETKGIVALRPRRHLPEYPAPGLAMAMREANSKTYWLVRNGERVYRTLTALKANDRVLPYSDEFDNLFMRREKGKKVPLRPGSYEWEKAQNAAQETERQYMRVGLVLEGLLHRTPIFHPLHPQGVSFLDPMCVRDGRVHYITDAEGLLTTGKETFEEWRRRLATETRVGMRIVLGHGLGRYDYKHQQGNERLHPAIAKYPGEGEVFTIEERKRGGELIFRYREGKRYVGDGAWGGGEYREPKKRASCTVFPDDAFVLPFDLATVEEMERFLTSRESRHKYVEMWPILKSAIASKEQEAELEAPFRVMLAGVLARDNKVSVEDASEAVPALVDWWKLKNRYHRPLVAAAHQDAIVDKDAAGDDWEAKAVRMIVAEHKRRLKDEKRSVNEDVIESLRSAHPAALLIAQQRSGGYLVLLPAEPVKNVYVHELSYSSAGKLKARKDWSLPGVTRPKQWKILEEGERWKSWDLTASERDHLRGPEIEAMIATVTAEMEVGLDSTLSYQDKLAGEEPDKLEGLALAWDGKEFTAWTMLSHLKMDEIYPLTGHHKAPKIEHRDRGWERKAGEVVLKNWSYAHEEGIGVREEEPLPWDAMAWRPSHHLFFDEEREQEPPKPAHNIIWRNEAAIAVLSSERDEYVEAADKKGSIRATISNLVDSVEEQWKERAWDAERARFDEDFGDPDLWEAHKGTKERDMRFPHELQRYSGSHKESTTLYDAIALLIENGIEVEGRSVGTVIADANERFGASERARRRGEDEWAKDDDEDKDEPWVFEADEELYEFILKIPEGPEQLEEPDEDDEFDDEDDDE